MFEARLVALLDEELVLLADDLGFDLGDHARLTGQLHEAHVAGAELGVVGLRPVVPDLKDVAFAQRGVQGQAKLRRLNAGLEQGCAIALQQLGVRADSRDDHGFELVVAQGLREQGEHHLLAERDLLLETINGTDGGNGITGHDGSPLLGLRS